jgi:hypothetical protein
MRVAREMREKTPATKKAANQGRLLVITHRSRHDNSQGHVDTANFRSRNIDSDLAFFAGTKVSLFSPALSPYPQLRQFPLAAGENLCEDAALSPA